MSVKFIFDSRIRNSNVIISNWKRHKNKSVLYTIKNLIDNNKNKRKRLIRMFLLMSVLDVYISTNVHYYCYYYDLQGNTIKLFWTYADKDPVYGNLKWFGTFSGVRSIHLLTPLWKKPNVGHNRDIRQWDVTVKNVSAFIFNPKLN